MVMVMKSWLFHNVCVLLSLCLCTTQTPFTFGLNQRAPYTAGDRCLLCRCERKDGATLSDGGLAGQNGTSQPGKTPSALQLPLWVCSDCRRTVEKEDRHTALEQSMGVRAVVLENSNCQARCLFFLLLGEQRLAVVTLYKRTALISALRSP